jgi:hypothetical protein
MNKAGLTTHPDYPQGSDDGRGQHQHLAEGPTTNPQYPEFPWQGRPQRVGVPGLFCFLI